MTIRIVRRRL